MTIPLLFSFFYLNFQDANECWVQVMRVLQQKLEPIEDDTDMEVSTGNTPQASNDDY